MTDQTSPVSETVIEAAAKAAAEAAGFCWGNCAQEQWRRDMRAGLSAALSFGVAQCSQQWQPIDTAPRDGRRILLCWDDSDTLSAHVELGKRKAFAWANTYGNPFSGEPTHWMPLPPAPSDTSTLQSSPAATTGDIRPGSRPPATAAMGLSAGGDTDGPDSSPDRPKPEFNLGAYIDETADDE